MGKLGTSKLPGVVRVRTVEKEGEILSMCDERGWKVIVGIEQDEKEDLKDVEKLMRSHAAVAVVRTHELLI